MKPRLAIIATHPIQYYAPWFRAMTEDPRIEVAVYYLSRHGLEAGRDLEFQREVRWDIDILSGYEHRFVPNASPWDSPQRWSGLWNPALVQTLRRDRPDAILMMGYNYPTFWNLILQSTSLPPLILKGDSHRLVHRVDFRRCLKDALIRYFFRRIRAFLYVGRANHEYFRAYGVSEEQLFYSPHAIDLERFQPSDQVEAPARALRKEWGVPEQARVLLFAGKWMDKKRPLDLLQAFEEAGLEDAHLVYIGGGEQEGALRERARRVSRVHVIGFMNQSEMPAVYRAADLFILPSHGPSETWGLAVQEAMAMGVPAIVSSHVGGAPDLIEPGRTGWIFPSGDGAALVGTLREAFEKSDLQMMRQSARKKVEERNYACATQGLIEAMESLCPCV